MSPLITLGCSSMFGMGRLGSRWQVLCLEFSADDDEDEQEALHISFLTICSGYPLLYLVE